MLDLGTTESRNILCIGDFQKHIMLNTCELDQKSKHKTKSSASMHVNSVWHESCKFKDIWKKKSCNNYF